MARARALATAIGIALLVYAMRALSTLSCPLSAAAIPPPPHTHLLTKALWWRAGKKRKAKRAAAKEAKKKKGDGSKELGEMFKMLWPGRIGRGWCTIDVRRPGGWYLAGLLLTALARTALHGYNLELTKRIMTSLYTRDLAAFQGTLSMQLLLGVGFALQRNIIDYCGQNLCLVWRQQLTEILHTNYFQAMFNKEVSQSRT